MIRALSIPTIATVSVWSPAFADDAPQPTPNADARFAFVALNVIDAAKSIAFYNTLLGLTELSRHEFGEVIEIGVGVATSPGGPQILLIQNKRLPAPYAAGERFSRIAFIVADVDAICRRYRQMMPAASCKPVTVEAARVRVVFVEDPDGNTVETIQLGA